MSKNKTNVVYDREKSRDIGNKLLDFIAANHLKDCIEVVVALDELAQFLSLSCNIVITEEMRKKREPYMKALLNQIVAMDAELENTCAMFN